MSGRCRYSINHDQQCGLETYLAITAEYMPGEFETEKEPICPAHLLYELAETSRTKSGVRWIIEII